jgi:excisionase family DNA binding protein
MSEQLLSLAEAAARLGVAVKTLKKRIREAGIRGPRPGREMKLTEADFDRLVEATRARTPAPEDPGEVAAARSPGEALRSLHRRQTQRLVEGLRPRPVVALALERRSRTKTNRNSSAK